MQLSRIELYIREDLAERGLDERTEKALAAFIINNNNDDGGGGGHNNTHLIIFICLIFEL
jgi:hypothetical protein